ncbi:hypothetical protein [Rhodococcus sp. 1168]|nr:hypothetical protein [Rhodococcus sp. 1168]
MSLRYEQRSSVRQRWSSRAVIGAVAVLIAFAGARTLALFAVTVHIDTD